MKVSNRLKEEHFKADVLIRTYNKYIKRLERADAFFNNENIPIEERQKQKYLEEYLKVVKCISLMQTYYKELTGYDMPEEEQKEGFKNREGKLI